MSGFALPYHSPAKSLLCLAILNISIIIDVIINNIYHNCQYDGRMYMY